MAQNSSQVLSNAYCIKAIDDELCAVVRTKDRTLIERIMWYLENSSDRELQEIALRWQEGLDKT